MRLGLVVMEVLVPQRLQLAVVAVVVVHLVT